MGELLWQDTNRYELFLKQMLEETDLMECIPVKDLWKEIAMYQLYIHDNDGFYESCPEHKLDPFYECLPHHPNFFLLDDSSSDQQ